MVNICDAGDVVGTLSESGSICLKNVLNRMEWINGAYGMLDGSLRKLRGGEIRREGRCGRTGCTQQRCFSSRMSFCLSLHPRPRAHLDKRIVHDGSVEDRCLHSAFCILIVNHRGERERSPFPPNCLGVDSSRGERDRTYR